MGRNKISLFLFSAAYLFTAHLAFAQTTNLQVEISSNLSTDTSRTANVNDQVVEGVEKTTAIDLITPTPTPTNTSTPIVTPPFVNTPLNSNISDNTPVVNGTAPSISSVKIYVDGIYVGTTTSNRSGNWTFTISSALATGTHQITARTVNTDGIESAPSSVLVISIRNEAVLDFDGDGITDITATRVSGDTLVYRSLLSTTESLRYKSIEGFAAVPGDYDGDKTWDYAAVSTSSDAIKWNVIKSTTGKSSVFNFGKPKDYILSGCRFIQGYYTPSIFERSTRKVKYRNLDGTVSKSFHVSVGNADFLGCGDIDSDGIDEVFFLVNDTKGVSKVVGINSSGRTVLTKRLSRFSRGFIVRSATTGLPVVGALRPEENNYRNARIKALRSTFEFPVFCLPGVVDVTSGSFEDSNDDIVTGVYWQSKKCTKIYKILSTDTFATIALELPTGFVITKPQAYLKNY